MLGWAYVIFDFLEAEGRRDRHFGGRTGHVPSRFGDSNPGIRPDSGIRNPVEKERRHPDKRVTPRQPLASDERLQSGRAAAIPLRDVHEHPHRDH